MRRIVGIVSVVLALAVMLAGVGAVHAESYPERPIRLIVPYGAGGGTDTVARIIQRGLEKVIPQPVAVVNIGGGASVVGMRELMNAEPDGYTMAINIINIWTNKALGTADFGPFEFEPVAQTGTYYLAVVTGANSPHQDLASVAKALQERPRSVVEATNIGAITHFTTLALQDAIGGGAQFRLVHIGDGANRISNVLGGHVDTTTMGTNEVKPFYDSGEMRVLAVLSPRRIPGLDNAPTAVEQGIDLVRPVSYWHFMPKGTPRERVEYMADALEKVMQDPEVVSALERLVMEPTFLRGEALVQAMQEQGDEILSIAERYQLRQ